MVGFVWLYCVVSLKTNNGDRRILSFVHFARPPEFAPRALEIAAARGEIPPFHSAHKPRDGVVDDRQVHVRDIGAILDPRFDVLEAHLPVNSQHSAHETGFVAIELFKGENVARRHVIPPHLTWRTANHSTSSHWT